jgi:hypothetical protein
MQNHFATAIIVWEGGYCIFFEILIIPANGRVAGSWELASGRNIWQSAFAGYGYTSRQFKPDPSIIIWSQSAFAGYGLEVERTRISN